MINKDDKKSILEKIREEILDKSKEKLENSDQEIEEKVMAKAKEISKAYNGTSFMSRIDSGAGKRMVKDSASSGSYGSKYSLGKKYYQEGNSYDAIEQLEEVAQAFSFNVEKDTLDILGNIYKNGCRNYIITNRENWIKDEKVNLENKIKNKINISSIIKQILIILLFIIMAIFIHNANIIEKVIPIAVDVVVITVMYLIPYLIMAKLFYWSKFWIFFFYIIFFWSMKTGTLSSLLPGIENKVCEYSNIITYVLEGICLIVIVYFSMKILITYMKQFSAKKYEKELRQIYENIFYYRQYMYEYIKSRLIIVDKAEEVLEGAGLSLTNGYYKEYYLKEYNDLFKNYSELSNELISIIDENKNN